MKKLISFALVALTAMAAQAQQVKYTINGVVADSVKHVSIYVNGQRQAKTTVDVKNGKFTATGSEEKNSILTIGYPMPRGLVSVKAVNDGTPVKVNLVSSTVTGSKTNNAFGSFQNEQAKNDEKKNVLIKEFRAIYEKKDEATQKRMGEIQKEYMAIEENEMKKTKDYIAAHKNDVTPAAFISQLSSSLEYDELNTMLDKTAAYYNHPMTEGAKKYLKGLEKRRPGIMFTDFAMNDTEGKEHKLSDWAGKGNYVLVDFWASWCGPCRAEMPNVVEVYKKYHEKGFEVVGVSFDSKAEAWKDAIQKLGLTWPHISDLKGWQCAAAGIYGIRGIPSNLLLDPQGKIVATDLRAEGLKEKMKEIYGF